MPIKLDYLRSGFDNHVLDWAKFHRQRLATSDAVLRQPPKEGRKEGGWLSSSSHTKLGRCPSSSFRDAEKTGAEPS